MFKGKMKLSSVSGTQLPLSEVFREPMKMCEEVIGCQLEWKLPVIINKYSYTRRWLVVKSFPAYTELASTQHDITYILKVYK